MVTFKQFSSLDFSVFNVFRQSGNEELTWKESNINTEAVVQMCSVMHMNGSVACDFTKKETLAQAFSSEFCKISKSTVS